MMRPRSRINHRKYCTQKEIEEATVVNNFEDQKTEDIKEEAVVQTEVPVGSSEKFEFQAETRKLLDIVACSLYTDKQVFIRELISNSSDALEKLRHKQVVGEQINDDYLPLEINILTDPKSNTLTIQDYGIGMTKNELMENLGTIARSGTSEFVKNLNQKQNATNLIGQFGVGFYSSFMVADKVTVYSKSATAGEKGYIWTSDGTGQYELCEADGVVRGTKVVMHLKPESKDFSEEKVVKNVISKYSNFVNFDIKLNGEKVNTIQAIWSKPKNEVSNEEHEAFYKFIANAYDKPTYKLHFQTDSPHTLQALFYVPAEHTEKYNLGRMEHGVSLYCRKVLIQSNTSNLLPDYLRFIRGVVDCEDIPLNLSREHLQDSQLISRLGNVLTRRILKFLAEEAERDKQLYEKFFNEFGGFLKEGAVQQTGEKEQILKLLRMESSKLPSDTLTSFDEYISRMPESQKEIYYLVTPKREFSESSPYMEHFKKKDIEVLFFHTLHDDWVMTNVSTYKGKKVKPIESADIPKDDTEEVTDDEKNKRKSFTTWIKDTLSDKVSSVKDSDRLVDSPAVVIDHESIAFRRMMMQVDGKNAPRLPKQTLEVNLKHPIMSGLMNIKDSDPILAQQIIEQVFDNALVAAGLMSDSRSMLKRVNSILEKAINSASK